MSLLNNKLYNNLHRFSHQAMNTIFEIVIAGEDKGYASQAAAAAFQEIDRLEEELSRFLPNSEVTRINNLKKNQSLKINIDVFELLTIANNIYNITGGIFDITAGRIIDQWKTKNKNVGLNPLNEKVGMDKILLDDKYYTLTVLSDNISLDLGGIGKGFAIDKASDLLREWEIENAVIHSGSTVKAIGHLENNNGWPVTISNPGNPEQTIAEVLLKDSSLSGSGKHKGEHIVNPLTSLPVNKRAGAWSLTKTATVSDAMSTTFMIMPVEQIEQFCKIHNHIAGLIIQNSLQQITDKELFFTGNFVLDNYFI